MYLFLVCVALPELSRERRRELLKLRCQRRRENVREGGGTFVGENWQKKKKNNVANGTVPSTDIFVNLLNK